MRKQEAKNNRASPKTRLLISGLVLVAAVALLAVSCASDDGTEELLNRRNIRSASASSDSSTTEPELEDDGSFQKVFVSATCNQEPSGYGERFGTPIYINTTVVCSGTYEADSEHYEIFAECQIDFNAAEEAKITDRDFLEDPGELLVLGAIYEWTVEAEADNKFFEESCSIKQSNETRRVPFVDPGGDNSYREVLRCIGDGATRRTRNCEASVVVGGVFNGILTDLSGLEEIGDRLSGLLDNTDCMYRLTSSGTANDTPYVWSCLLNTDLELADLTPDS